jgi:hypothetical protein
MAQQTNNLRERLLKALPQPENLAAYREETLTLLAKHERALRWDKISTNVLYACGLGVLFVSIWVSDHWTHHDPYADHGLQFIAALMWFVGAVYDVRYRIYDSQIANLKEIKQVQLQVLELQESLRNKQ